MGQGPGIMQREILRRARGAFSVREIAQKLYVRVDDAKLGGVRRAINGLVAMGYLAREPVTAGTVKRGEPVGRYRRTAKRQFKRREWKTEIGPDRITLAEANVMLEGRHYLGPLKNWHVDYCLATPARDALAIYRPPMAVMFNAALERPLELSRLWRADDCPFPSSQFLSATLNWIKRMMRAENRLVDCVFAYTDPQVRNSATGRRHGGIVYEAANFAYLGPSAPTPYWLKPDGSRVEARQVQRLLGTKDSKKVAALEPSWQYVPGEPKVLFIYPMELSVDQVRAKLGTGRYSHVLEPPNLWD